MANLTIVAGRAPRLLHGAMQVARGRIIFAKGDAGTGLMGVLAGWVKITAMRSSNTYRELVSVTRRCRATMSNARRKVTGSTEGK